MLVHFLVITVIGVGLGAENYEYVCPTLEQMGPCQCQGSYMGLDVFCEDIEVDEVQKVLKKVSQLKPYIWYLTLRNILMSSLPSNLMAGLRVENLVVLNCPNLTSVENETFVDMAGTLERLILPHNSFEIVPSSAFSKLSELLYLNMKFNKLQILHSEAFKGLDSLTHLSLYGNRIHFIDFLAFAGIGSKLLRLRLDDNLLRTVPSRALRKLWSLQILDLAGNKISAVRPNELVGMSLKHLNLANNTIRRLAEGSFETLSHLMTLDLSGNFIESVEPFIFEGIDDTLTSLKLGNNKLKSVPSEALRNMTRLYSLDLQGNRICEVLKYDFVPYGRTLTNIHLQNNLLTHLDQASLRTLYSLKNLHIDGNPFHCDCHLNWLLEWIDGYGYDIVKLANETKCSSPKEYADRPLASLRSAELSCGDYHKPPCCNCITNSHRKPTSDGFLMTVLQLGLAYMLTVVGTSGLF